MKKISTILIISVLAISGVFAVDYSDSGSDKSAVQAQQDVTLTLSGGENPQSYFEVGFGSEDTPNSSPVALTVNETNAIGSVGVYWNISTAESYKVQIKADKALESSTAGDAGATTSVEWAISDTAFQTVPSAGDYNAKNVSGASSNGGVYKKNAGTDTFYIATEALDAETGYSGTYSGTITLSIASGD